MTTPLPLIPYIFLDELGVAIGEFYLTRRLGLCFRVATAAFVLALKLSREDIIGGTRE